MITGLLVLAAEIARTFLSAPAERRNLSVKISLARQAPLLCSVRSARLCNAEAHWRGCRMRGVKIKEKNRPARDDLPGHRCKKFFISLIGRRRRNRSVDCPRRQNMVSYYTQQEVRELIAAYGELGEEGLWANLERFLKKVIPVAEECGVKMAIHPDDPPYPIFGLPRIITCEENLDRFLKLVDSPANCLCLCTGSLGCAASNDVVAMVRKYAAMGRIAFMHIRNVKIMEDGSFEERAHLSSCGSLDISEIVRVLVENGFDGYVRPDHGRMIWGEEGKPGYGLYDRALGAAYINGLFEAWEKALKA